MYEALGTAILLCIYNMTGGKSEGLGIGLFIGVAVLGPVSGGHFNPAVTLAVFIKERKC